MIVYLNDIEIKDLKIKYNNEKILSEIKKYVLKYLQYLNQILVSIEFFSTKLNEEKSQFC